MWLGRVCVCFVLFCFGARAHSISICTDYFIILHLVVRAYPHSSWYECLMGETGINHTLVEYGMGKTIYNNRE